MDLFDWLVVGLLLNEGRKSVKQVLFRRAWKRADERDEKLFQRMREQAFQRGKAALNLVANPSPDVVDQPVSDR